MSKPVNSMPLQQKATQHHLGRAIYSQISKSPELQEKVVKDAFSFLDKNYDGELSWKEFQGLIQMKAENQTKEVALLADFFDADGDHEITIKDFQAFTWTKKDFETDENIPIDKRGLYKASLTALTKRMAITYPEYEKALTVEPDTHFKQRSIGSCEILAVLNSIVQSKSGKELINQAVSADKNGNLVAAPFFFGNYDTSKWNVPIDFITYTATPFASTGNPKVKVLELASYLSERRYVKGSKFSSDNIGYVSNWSSPITQRGTYNLSFESYTAYLEKIFNKKLSDIEAYKAVEQRVTGLLNQLGQSNSTPTIAITTDLEWDQTFQKKIPASEVPLKDAYRREVNLIDLTGNEFNIITGHVYSVTKTNPRQKTVTVVNPWDTSKTHTITYQQFLDTFGSLDVYYLGPPNSKTSID